MQRLKRKVDKNGYSPYEAPYECDKPGEDFLPLTFQEAKKWYEKKLNSCYHYMSIVNAKDPAPNYKTYCKLFGNPENDQ